MGEKFLPKWEKFLQETKFTKKYKNFRFAFGIGQIFRNFVRNSLIRNTDMPNIALFFNML